MLLEKLTVSQLVKKRTVFYGIRRFITVFTRVGYLSVSWARWIQSTPCHPSSLGLFCFTSVIFYQTIYSEVFQAASFKFPHQTLVRICLFYHTCHMLRPYETDFRFNYAILVSKVMVNVERKNVRRTRGNLTSIKPPIKSLWIIY